jgi:CubicO group peptidase (beta-lactamase class C family)
MKTSTITDGPHPETGVSHGYELNDNKQFVELDYGEEPTFAAAGNGGVWSNVEELWKYEQAIQKDIFLSKQWIDSSRTVFTQPNWTSNVPSVLGLSWFITNDSGVRMIGHTGSQGGFRADYIWVPDTKTFYVLLTNTPKPLAEIRKKVLAIINQ